MNGTIVHIETAWARQEWQIFIFERAGRFLRAAKPVELLMEDVGDYVPGEDFSSKIQPWLTIDKFYGSMLFPQLVAKLAEIGFRVGDGGKEKELVDILKAKDGHLEDMRRIALLNYPEIGRKP